MSIAQFRPLKQYPHVTIMTLLSLMTLVISLPITTACGRASTVNPPAAGPTSVGTTPQGPPTLTLTATPLTGTTPLTVTFVAKCSTCVAYTWSFGDGGVQSTPGPNQAYTYQSSGTFNAVVAAVDIQGNGAKAQATVTANPALAADPDNTYCSLGNIVLGAATDGPASLPQRCINSSLASTPSPGQVIPLASGGNLQSAYNDLLCGQTLSLAHGATWDGPIQFTPKGCDDQHWITITSDGVLPPAGTRIDASYLPQLASISMKPNASANMVTGDHIRFIGIAWLKQPGKALVDFVEVPGAMKVIFDRNYAHGNPGEEIRRFINLVNGSYIAIVESFVDEMHCIAGAGSCTDSQAISGGGTDSLASGPFKIVNNYLSAAAENIMFGGAKATNTPCDIEIRGNYLHKPISWNPMDPSFAGTKYMVKNLFELKNACRVLLEGNVLANIWGGFSQNGSAILIGPKNQNGATDVNLCPLCFISDVVVRYNYITTAAATFEIFNAQNGYPGGWAAGGHNYSIHDLIFDNQQYPTCYQCAFGLGQISSGYLTTDAPPVGEVMHDVLINHLTIVTVPTWPLAGSKHETAMINMDGPPAGNSTSTPQMLNIVYENSLFGGGGNGLYPTGGDQSDNCSVGQATLANMITACWTGLSSFSGNLVVNYTGTSTWPDGNLFSPSWSDVDFINYNNGDGGDYHLAASSPFRGRALDGADPGANVDLVVQYTASSMQ